MLYIALYIDMLTLKAGSKSIIPFEILTTNT
jgi:hypothetical protein